MNELIFFHRSQKSAFSINKVTQTIISHIENKKEIFVPYTGTAIKSICGNIAKCYNNRNKKGINHITGEIYYCTLGLIGCKSIITIHDTVSIDFQKGSKLKKLILELLWYRIPLKIADRVICISEETRKCVQHYTNRSDIVVIHNAVDPDIEHRPKVFNRECPRILIIGTNPNKNIERTVKALRDINCKVVIIGKLKPSQIDALRDNQIDYENKIGLSNAEVREEFYNCDIVSFISLFEGFGMPVIEANKAGRVIITSNIPVIKEVGGNSAYYVNPNNTNEIHEAFIEIITNSNLRKNLISRGLENIKQYEWTSILPQWLNVYNSL